MTTNQTKRKAEHNQEEEDFHIKWHDIYGWQRIENSKGPTVDAIEAALFQEYTKQLIIAELEEHSWKSRRIETRAQRYVNSTPSRGVLARLLVVASCVNKPYTKTEIADQLGVSRQTAHQLVKECLQEGWAEECNCCQKRYKASPAFIKTSEDYVRFKFDLMTSNDLYLAYSALSSFRKIRQVS